LTSPLDTANVTRDVISSTGSQTLESAIPAEVMRIAREDHQRTIPALAKDKETIAHIERGVSQLSTRHELYLGDSRLMRSVPDESVHLAVTSPPYWTLKTYPDREGQLGLVEQYEVFLDELDKVWREVFRALVPGGRLVVVAGDVCLSRRRFGRARSALGSAE
jgi:tRNA1(Val) A37 N6-methylase TrmN6